MPLSPTSLSSIASRLPFDLLLHVFLSVKELALEERGEYMHGGQLVGWDSNEVVAPFALVCRGWAEAAFAVLYRSVSLRGGAAAKSFAATVRARPALAEMVHWLAIGLADEEEEEGCGSAGEGAEGWAVASEALVGVLRHLPCIEHLLLRPLDLSARPELLAWFALPSRLSLTSLVLIARAGPRWGHLLHPPDATLVFPHLRRLDVDVNTSVVLPENPTFAPFSSLAITHLCFTSNLPASLTYPLLSSTLTTLYLYFEHLRPAREAADALARAPNLQHLCYICNPLFEELEADYESHAVSNSTPVLDLALPSLHKLETLVASATELSSSFLGCLPPHLRRMAICAFSLHGFGRPSRVLDMMRDARVDVKELQELEIRDSTERWPAELRSALVGACRCRGVRFVFVADDEDDEAADAG